MSGHRSIILLLMLLQLTSTGCQTDGTGRFAWNPFRKKTDTDAISASESETPPVSRNFFARRQEQKAESESTPPMATEQLERLLSQGRLALQENRIEDAEKAYSDVLQSLPDNATAHHGLAMAADLTEKWDEAEYHYRQALRSRPRDPDLLCDIGYSYLLQNRYSEAESYLTHALEVSPQHESALMNLAMLDLRQGKRTSAERRLADRFGSTGQTSQVMAQLEEQVASLGGGIIPASASSNSTRATENAALRPDLNPSDRTPMAGPGMPEVPANASLEEVLQIARREGAEAERRRVAQNAGRDPAGGTALATSDMPTGNAPHQPSVWPGNSNVAANPNVNPPFVERPAANKPAASGSGYAGQPTHVFGTLQPRNANPTTLNAPTASVPGATGGPGSVPNGSAVDPMEWANSRPISTAPNFLQGAPNGSNGPVAQPVSNNNVSPPAGTPGDSAGGVTHGQNSPTAASHGSYRNGIAGMSNASMAQSGHGAGQGGSALNMDLPNGGAPIAVRSSGAFQQGPNAGNSYGMPYGFGSGSGQPPVNTVSNSTATSINGQPSGTSNANAGRPASQGMYLDGLNVGPGSLFPVYPNSSGMNANPQSSGSASGVSQPGQSNNLSSNRLSMMSGSSVSNGMPPASNVNPAGVHSSTPNASGSLQNNALRMGNISSPGTGSMINGAMFSQPDSTLPSVGVVNGGGINSTSNLPGWPSARPTQANPLEAYERQRQQLDDEYNRTLEQLDRNSPTSSSRAQY